MATRKQRTTRAIVEIQRAADGGALISVGLPGALPIVWTQRAGDPKRAAAKVARRLERDGHASAGAFGAM